MNLVITTTDINTTDVLASLNKGTATVHSERDNGTFRRRHFLAEGTKDREIAEWVSAQRTGQEPEGDEAGWLPRTMKDIANEMHVSVSAVRRILNDLALTEEIEEMEEEELSELLQGAN